MSNGGKDPIPLARFLLDDIRCPACRDGGQVWRPGVHMADRLDSWENPQGGSIGDEEFSKKGFTGLFSGMDLPNLIQMYAMNAITGVLRVQNGTRMGEIFLKRGEVVHATCGLLSGLDAFHHLIAWQGGEIILETGINPPRETIELPWHALLIHSVAHLEDQEAGSSPEPAPESRLPQAKETLRLHKFYTDAMNWDEVENCLIYSLDRGELIRPSMTLPKMPQWGRFFKAMLELSRSLPALGEDAGPSMISVSLGRQNWLLIPHDAHLIGLEVPRGVDMEAMMRRVTRTLARG